MPVPRNLDVDLLRTFVSVVELGGFTRAAYVLLRRQSTLSLQIKCLEEAVGHRLLERTGRLTRPTMEGAAILPRARQMLDINDQVLVRLDEHKPAGAISRAVHSPKARDGSTNPGGNSLVDCLQFGVAGQPERCRVRGSGCFGVAGWHGTARIGDGGLGRQPAEFARCRARFACETATLTGRQATVRSGRAIAGRKRRNAFGRRDVNGSNRNSDAKQRLETSLEPTSDRRSSRVALPKTDILQAMSFATMVAMPSDQWQLE